MAWVEIIIPSDLYFGSSFLALDICSFFGQVFVLFLFSEVIVIHNGLAETVVLSGQDSHQILEEGFVVNEAVGELQARAFRFMACAEVSYSFRPENGIQRGILRAPLVLNEIALYRCETSIK